MTTRTRRRMPAPLPAVLAAAVALGLVGCTHSEVVEGSEVRVVVADPLTSLNAGTSYGRASTTNADVAHLTGTGFGYLDPHSELVLDESFGTAAIVERDPLTVRYTIADDAHWSDGVPVDGADLLLSWAANSGALNEPEFADDPYIDAETGRYTDEFPEDVVYFDGAIAGGIELATSTPQLAEDGRTVFLRFDEFVPGWRTVLAPGVPAHVLAERALQLPDEATPEDAKAAVATAILDGDAGALAPLSRSWNRDFDLPMRAAPEASDEGAATPAATPEPIESALKVSAGPYVVEELDADGGVTLVVNPEYTGQRRPGFETIRLIVASDPLEAASLVREGEADVVSPPPTEDVAAALADAPDVSVRTGIESRIEHLDLQFADGKSGTFDDPLVREAFLLTVPRPTIVDELVAPLHPDATVLDSFVVRENMAAYSAVVDENGSAAYGEPDLDAARDLLAEAGVDAPSVCVLYDAANPRRRAEYELIAASATEAGFRMSDCSSGEWERLLGVAGTYDAALFAWDTTWLGPAAIGAVFHSRSDLVNLNRYANPEVDDLIDQLGATDEAERRDELLARIDEHLWADAYGLPLYSHPTLTAVRDGIEGVSRSPLARGVFWNAWEWRPAADGSAPSGG